MKQRSQLLMQESAHLHDGIQRNINDMQKVLYLGFPALTGAFAFAIQGRFVMMAEADLLYALFSILLSVLVVTYNIVWMQLSTMLRYKYAEVVPRLYGETGRNGENFGQHLFQGGMVRPLIGPIIFQAMLLPTALATTYQMWSIREYGTFAIPAYISVTFAIATTLVSWPHAGREIRAIQTSRTASSSGQNHQQTLP